MKKASDDLFRLIKSLNKSEKGYFKKFAKRNSSGDDKNTIKLFDAIEKQADGDEYDEEAIKKKFEGETFVKQFPVTKNYLYNLILKSLNLYYTENSIERQVREALSNAQLLRKKGLLDQSKKLIKKARALASEFSSDMMMLELIRFEKVLDFQTSTGSKRLKLIKSHFESEDAMLDKMKNISRYMMLANSMAALHDKFGTKRNTGDDEFDALLKDPYLASQENAVHYDSKIFYHNIHAQYYLRKLDYEKVFRTLQSQLELIESEPAVIKYYVRDYLLVLQDLVYFANLLKHKEEAERYIKKLKDLKERLKNNTDKFVQTLLHNRAANMELAMLIDDLRYEEGIEVIKIIEKDVDKFRDTNRWETFSLFYKIAYFYYVTGDYDNALKWVNILLNEADDDIGSEIYSFVRILNIIIHFELGNKELMEYILQSTYRYLQTNKRLFKTETLFMKLIKSIIGAVTDKDIKDAFREFKFRLDKIKDNSNEKAAFEYFDFPSWAEGKIAGKPMIEVQRKATRAV
jgi:tetratricopeptide (TPR) repeat protein